MRLLVIILLIEFVCGCKSHAQILFSNPSLEGQPCWGYCYPDNWSKCYTTSAIINTDSSYWQPEFGYYHHPSEAVDGKTFFVIENQRHASTTLELGDLSQKLPCVLQQSKTYSFSFYSASVFFFDTICFCSNNSSGYLSVYIGNDSCDRSQKIHLSSKLDTIWTQQVVTFTPIHGYQWVSFWPERDSSDWAIDMGIDAFSPIYLVNANAVSVDVQDTTLGAGACVTLTATPSISTADTVYWLRQVGAQVDTFGYGQWSVQVCPTATTTYIAAMRDSVVGCAGVEWSFDTARVEVPVGLPPSGVSAQVRVYPNPAKDFFTIEAEESGVFELYNPLGQILFITPIVERGKAQQFPLWGLGGCGVYYYKFIFNNKTETYGKLVKQ